MSLISLNVSLISLNVSLISLSVTLILSGPILRDTARLSQRYPPIARYGVFGVSTWPIGCDTPSPFSEHFPLESMRSGGAIPPLRRGISAILARYPMKTRQMGAIPPSAILSRKGIARYGGVSRTGPLSSHPSECLSLYLSFCLCLLRCLCFICTLRSEILTYRFFIFSINWRKLFDTDTDL